MLVSKQAKAKRGEQIATECPKLKFSIEKIKKVNLSKRIPIISTNKKQKQGLALLFAF